MRESENQYDSDGAVMNGFDEELRVWVAGGIVQNCPHPGECRCNGPLYATRAVKFIDGHEVHR